MATAFGGNKLFTILKAAAIRKMKLMEELFINYYNELNLNCENRMEIVKTEWMKDGGKLEFQLTR